jgi:hypothetical protein
MREEVNGVLGGPIVKERKTAIPSAKISTNCRIQTETSPTTRPSGFPEGYGVYGE